MLKPKGSKKYELSDPDLERDFGFLLKNYFKGDAIFDILANVPMLVYKIYLGMPASLDTTDLRTWTDAPVFWICMTLQLLRLFHYDNVGRIYKRIIDKLQVIFFRHGYLLSNILSWTLTI